MATYVNDLRLKEIATGDESGTWGSSTNTNLELIGEALSFGTEAITTNADTHTTTVADGASDPGRAMYLKYTGTLDSACTITIAPNTISRMQFIENGTSGSQNIIISQGSGANVTIPAGDVKAVYLDGAGSGAAVVDAFAGLKVTDAAQTNITSLGTLTTLTVDDITINGSTISDAGDFTLDVGGDISLDADGGDVIFKDDGTTIAKFSNSSSDFVITSDVDDKDIIFKGQDSTSEITALTLDMSEAGAATFNDKVIADSFETVAGGTITTASGNDLNIVYPDTRSLFIKEASTTHVAVDNTGKVGIGTATPGDLLTVTNGDNSVDTRIRLDAFGQLPMLDVRFAAGTSSSPTAATSGTEILRLASSPFDGSDYSQSAVNLRVVADANFSSNSTPAHLAFDTNSTTRLATEKMRLDKDGNLGIGESSPAATLHVEHSSGTAYNGATELTESIIVSNKAGTDDSGVNNVASIGLHVADGATSQGFINYVRTGNNTGNFTFTQRTAGSTYRESMRITNNGFFLFDTTVNAQGTGIAVNSTISSSSTTAIEIQQATTGANKAAAAFGVAIGNGGESTNAADLTFLAASGGSLTERMRITSEGRLCLGFTAKQEDAFLSIISNGSEGLFNGTAGTNRYRRYFHTASSGVHSFESSSNTATLTNAGAWSDASDVAYKEDIQDISYGLDAVKALRPRKYKMKGTDLEDGKGLDQKIGFIAQEAELVVPEVVDGEDGKKTLSYGQLTAVLTKAIQELETRVTTLEG